MEKEQVLRINELARKRKAEGLTEAEQEEQAALRRQYIQEFRANLQTTLDNTKLKRPDGTLEPLQKKR